MSMNASIARQRAHLILGGIADQPLPIRRPSHERRRDAVALIVGADLHPPVLPHGDTAARVSGAEPDASSGEDTKYSFTYHTKRQSSVYHRKRHSKDDGENSCLLPLFYYSISIV